MKKIVSSKKLLLLMIIGLIAFCIVTIIGFIKFIDLITNKDFFSGIIIFIIIVFFIFMMLIIILLINQLSCFVWFDKKTNELCRKGLFFGYYYRVNILDIHSVVIKDINKQTRYIIFVDNHGNNFDGIFKKAYIRLEFSERNLEFVKTFWKGRIESERDKI